MKGKEKPSRKETETMNKKTFEWHGKKHYFLGNDSDGIGMYYVESKFDCDWYWGIGYIQQFSNNRNPQRSADIITHTHWDYLFQMEEERHGRRHVDAFNAIFHDSPFTNDEKWKIMELMNALYTARKYSDMLHIGGGNYTLNPCKDVIKNEEEYKRINEVVIPAMLNALYAILEG